MARRGARAEQTGQRILHAARSRFAVAPYDEVALADIAADAAVTVQTVLRRFESKEGLVRAIYDQVGPVVAEQRDAAPVGDIVGAVANLVAHYEEMGDEVLNLLRQESRVPAFAEITRTGRAVHAAWVARVFEPWVRQRRGVDRQRLTAQLIAMCDLYTWSLLRRQAGLSRAQTTRALVEMLEGVLE